MNSTTEFLDKRLYCSSKLQRKTFLLICSLFFIFYIYEALSPAVTFFLLDLVVCVYLVSLFTTRFKYLFLIHPFFILLSSYGFQIPFSEIGVGFTYMNTFSGLVDPANGISNDSLASAYEEKSQGFGVGVVYVGILPIIGLPSILYETPPDITLYYSMSLFTVLYASIAAYVSQTFGILERRTLLVIILYATVSPTFFDINSTLHRYGLLVLGLILFLVSYIGLFKRNKSFLSKVGLTIVFFLSMILIVITKPQIIYVLTVFIGIESLKSYKLPIFSRIYQRMDKRLFWILLIVALQILGVVALPGNHISAAYQSGGQMEALSSIPLLGFLTRVIYATLSPFPWVGFEQMELYGFNHVMFIMHIFSTLFASWFLISIVLRSRFIFREDGDDNSIVTFGICNLLALMFSAIGYHVYLAPALPFLAVVILRQHSRVSMVYPLIFCFSMEVFAQLARF